MIESGHTLQCIVFMMLFYITFIISNKKLIIRNIDIVKNCETMLQVALDVVVVPFIWIMYIGVKARVKYN